MRSESFSANALVRLLRRRTIATMDELKEALGSPVDMTVFRKLRTLSYLASYSHPRLFTQGFVVAEARAESRRSARVDRV
jgi:hypothetical protein